MTKFENDIIKNAKLLAIDMINEAGSGHPGISLDIAEILYALYGNVLNINPCDSWWINRDRVILSAGHGSAILYATLFLTGYNLELSDLQNFRKLNSITPGHPEYGVTPGVDATTGALGNGIATAVGTAMAERYYRSLIQKEKKNCDLINYYTFCIVGDGDLMEGISYEALSFAGNQKLNKLIVIYNCNKMSIDGNVDKTFTDDMLDRFDSINFDVIKVKKNSHELIEEAINTAKKNKKPTLIIVNTKIGKDSLLEGTNKVHGTPLEKSDIKQLKLKYKQNEIPFYINEKSVKIYQSYINARVNKNYQKWLKEYDKIINEKNQKIIDILKYIKRPILDLSLENIDFKINPEYSEELRICNQKIINIISKKNSFFIGGSCDLNESCKTKIIASDYNSNNKPLEKNIAFGVREHAMGGILNGMALSGLKVFGSTFLAFSDYLKPSIRFSALMNLPVTYIFTHDSISIGYDGPTHEPIEQLSSLRMIPNFQVFRPADINEVIGSWDVILKSGKPSALIISKDKLKVIKNTNHKYIKYGAYMVRKEIGKLDGIIIATGEELSLAMNVADELLKADIQIRVVSMPCMELFLKQNPRYEEQLLPKEIKTFVIEASNPLIWNRFASNKDCIFGINNFGKSGHPSEIKNEYGFTVNKIKEKIIIELSCANSTEFL